MQRKCRRTSNNNLRLHVALWHVHRPQSCYRVTFSPCINCIAAWSLWAVSDDSSSLRKEVSAGLVLLPASCWPWLPAVELGLGQQPTYIPHCSGTQNQNAFHGDVRAMREWCCSLHLPQTCSPSLMIKTSGAWGSSGWGACISRPAWYSRESAWLRLVRTQIF